VIQSAAGRWRIRMAMAFTIAALAGCGGQTVVVPPAGELGDKAAVFKISPVVDAGARGSLYGIVDLKTGEDVVPRGSIRDKKVKVAPGDYKVTLWAESRGRRATPEVAVRARPGMSYHFSVRSTLNESAAKATYIEMATFADHTE